jgi:hypothetical protein
MEMSQEFVVTRNKKKQTKSPFGQPRIEESQERYSTQDEGDSGVIARDIRIAMREEIKKVNDHEEKLFALENRKLDEKFFTARNSLTNSELGNVAKIVLADPTVTLGTGKQTSRQHKKVAFFWHKDTESTTEITLQRGGAEER